MSPERDRRLAPRWAAGDNPAVTSCAVCGTTVDKVPVTWSSQVSERGPQWLCERCTRETPRSIEGRLDEAWW